MLSPLHQETKQRDTLNRLQGRPSPTNFSFADDDGVFGTKGSLLLGLPRVRCNAPLMRFSLILMRIGQADWC